MTLVKRHPDSHKGKNGEVLVIAGSETYTGAPCLASLAVLRGGADLVYLAAPERAANAADVNPDLITIPLDGGHFNNAHIPKIKKWLKRSNVLLIGPGLGKEPETEKAILSVIEDCKLPMVIDADAVKALAGNLEVLKGKKAVLTPHRKEFELISKQAADPEKVKKFTSEHDFVMLVKAPEDIVTDGTRLELNKTGNAGMTVGGTGDVLAGLIAALIAQGLDLFDSALNGAKINGMAGDLCFEKMGYGFIASDLLEKIPEIMKDL